MGSDEYSHENEKIILEEARKSIEYYINSNQRYIIDADSYPIPLQEKKATFVTLKKNDSLRGCIGILEAQYPLIEDVVRNAYSAAFQDYRFSPLSLNEIYSIHISVSVLTTPTPMSYSSREDFYSQIKKGEDGIILKRGTNRATFLPSVWESIDDVSLFIMHLMAKAGIAKWDNSIKAERYRVIEISE